MARHTLESSEIRAYRRREITRPARNTEGRFATPWMLQIAADGRWRRVYVLSYCNGGGTPYVSIGNETYYLSEGVERTLDAHAEDMAAFAHDAA